MSVKAWLDKLSEDELRNLAEHSMEYLKEVCPKKYEKAKMKLYTCINGYHFDQNFAEKAVSEMQNIDGTEGEHFTYSQVEELAKKQGIEEVWDLYYAMNMLYSDCFKIFGSNVGMYLELAKALYFSDPDMIEGKLFIQWYAIEKCKMK